jgi:membrane protein YdbS with pleckstrin-like domain
MPIEAQPPRHKGTIDQPYSALNLRLALAIFGLVVSLVLAVLLLIFFNVVAAAGMFVLAVIAVVDIVVIQLRRRARRRAGDTGHSIFE